jgi:hypothetical protein
MRLQRCRDRVGRALIAALVLVSLARPASAYCQVTTCNPERETCSRDSRNCITQGVLLAWRSRALTFVVDARGSELRGISGEQLLEAATMAAQSWRDVRCSDGNAPLDDWSFELADADAAFVPNGANQNVIRFVDAAWPHASQALGKTVLGVDLDTGEILDADIVVNSQVHEFSLDPEGTSTDLVAVLTHELGHALGLDHSSDTEATMRPETRGFATSELRDLAADDSAGLCAIYPSTPDGANDEVPIRETVGCGLAGRVDSTQTSTSAWWAVVTLLVLVRRARRRSPFRPLLGSCGSEHDLSRQ